ncbi:MAG: pilus assembly protein N-terminal domain-containing protein, partial [Oscillospiraceae bacterium]|nr:pilus assembly protein N-terminal domain-containing protein [Oscillospiraceae bacterium]
MNARKRITKSLALFIAALVILGAYVFAYAPQASAAGVAQTSSVKLDFKEAAIEMSEQDWWQDLRPAADADTMFIGSRSGEDVMSDATKAAYSSMQTFLKDTYGWTIDETVSCFTNSYYLKRLFFNCSPDIPWGVSYYAYYMTIDDRNDLGFIFDAPEAGWYRLDVEAFHEKTTGAISTEQTTGLYAGSGYGDIYVNGRSVYQAYCFRGENQVLTNGLGAVYLNEGENSVVVSEVLDYLGGTESSRRSIALTSLEFVKLGDLYVETAADETVDLSQSYLPFDGTLTAEYEVSSANTAIAKVAVSDDGKLIVSGMKVGSTTITLTKGGVKLFDIPVRVMDSVSSLEDLTRFSYTLNGFEALTLRYGQTGTGSLTALSNFQNEYPIETIRRLGDVYFMSDNTGVARVDQAQGDVTCVGEGEAVITAYIQIDDALINDKVRLSVTDDTDLVSITLDAPVDHVGVGNGLQLTAAGRKASGGAADMSDFPVAYRVDDETVAKIDDSGYLIGLSAGTVTVTGTCGVQRTAICDEITIDVVDNSELAGLDVVLDFTDGRAQVLHTATVEKDGMELNKDLTVSGGTTLSYATKHGIMLSSAYIGDRLAIDLAVKKDGWYVIETWGSLFSYGGVADVFMDDVFVGQMDFNQGKGDTYTGNSIMNTIYLEAGTHTCVLECVQRGSFFLGKIVCRATTDPNEMDIRFTAPEELLKGQTADAILDIETRNGRGRFTLKTVSAKPSYTNYCIITSSAPNVVSVSGNTLTAVRKGSAVITLKGEIAGQTIQKTVKISVVDGSVFSASLSAGQTTMKPTASGTTLTLTAYGVDGASVSIPSGASVRYVSEDTSIASVSSSGLVKITGKEGSAKIRAVITENGREVEASVWITVTAGKTAPTIFTYEERANAIENVSKYSWAANMKTSAVRTADKVVEALDTYYAAWIHQTFPRRTQVGAKSDPEAYFCRYCKKDLSNSGYSVYPWIVDPINNPWKITCPSCKRDFPSNDFEAYYKSGLGTDGRFYADKADSSLLVNELYPEMGAGWGVDDGFGYVTGKTYANGVKEVHTYIGYYMHCVFDSLSKYAVNDMIAALTALQEAYLYTGDEKYGSAGAILLDRVADIYPSYDYYTHDSMYGGFDKGKMVNAIWEAVTIGQCLAQAADAFWPAMDNADVIEYLKAHAAWKGVSASQITPEYVRSNVDEGILLQIRKACESGNSLGNFGMHQAAMAYAAVALDRLPETEEMIDWIFRYGENKTVSSREMRVTGGNVLYRLVTAVDRDGIGNEGSNMYNPMWFQNLMEVANALNGYDRVKGADLWENPKFVTMFNALNRLVLCGSAMVTTGEAGSVQSYGSYADADCMLEAFIQTGDRELARGLYYVKGNSVSGLHASIFTKDPEAGIQSAILKIVEEDGEWNWNRSEMLCGEGIAILRNGPAKYQKSVNDDKFSDYWMFFGIGGGSHGAFEALNIGVEAFGVIASPTLGYPKVVSTSDPERMQWMLNTVSHNTVVVNDKAQSRISTNSFPLHFDDAGEVKLVDAEAPGAYGEADIYRRTLVSVKAQEDVYYAVDFFRVLGGREHVYSFHAASTIAPGTEGLDLVHQPIGTYAGPEIPLGFHQTNPDSSDAGVNMGSGYSWLDNVYRDDRPQETFSVDFAIEDFNNRVLNSKGIRLRLTMLADEPMDEVAIADGHPTQNGRNPEILKYLLVRRSGTTGMDTLFTSVIQPYKDAAYIASSELLEMIPVEGKERPEDRAAAVKVTLTSGRTDYIMYSSAPDVTYSVMENGKEVLRFCGFTGVCSYQSGVVVYVYGSESKFMKDAAGTTLYSSKTPRVTGTVSSFTQGLAEQYSMTIQMDTAVTAEELTGKYIYVDNDGLENGAYQIYGAEVDGDTAILDLHTQTLVRTYADKNDMSKGYVYNIRPGQTYSIPLNAETSCFHTKISVSYTSNGDGTHTMTRKCSACGVPISSTVAACKDGTDADDRCDRCGSKIPTACDHTNTTTAVTANGDKTHTTTVTCTCGEVVSTETADCADEDKDTLCDVCGGTYVTIKKFSMAGSNMTLGNELEVNFLFLKKNLTETDCTAIVTHYMADGTTKVTEIPQADW